MPQLSFNPEIFYTEEVTKDKADTFTATVEHCRRVLKIDSTKYLDYDTTSAAIRAVEYCNFSPLLLERVSAIVAELVPHKANDKSFVAKVKDALDFYSSEDADEQLFVKRLVERTNGKEFAYFLSPDITRDGLAYSRYLVHLSFNMAHYYGDADFINFGITRCSLTGYPELLELFITRLKEFCYNGARCDYDNIYTYYVRFIYRKSNEDAANSLKFFKHLVDLACFDDEFHDAMMESQRNLSLQNFSNLHLRQVSIMLSSHI